MIKKSQLNYMIQECNKSPTKAVDQFEMLLDQKLINEENCFDFCVEEVMDPAIIDQKDSKNWKNASKFINANRKTFSLRLSNCSKRTSDLIDELSKNQERKKKVQLLKSGRKKKNKDQAVQEQTRSQSFQFEPNCRFDPSRILAKRRNLDMELKSSTIMFETVKSICTFNPFQLNQGNKFMNCFQIQEDLSFKAVDIESEYLIPYNMNFDLNQNIGCELFRDQKHKWEEDYKQIIENISEYKIKINSIEETNRLVQESEIEKDFDWVDIYKSQPIFDLGQQEDIKQQIVVGELSEQQRLDSKLDNSQQLKQINGQEQQKKEQQRNTIQHRKKKVRKNRRQNTQQVFSLTNEDKMEILKPRKHREPRFKRQKNLLQQQPMYLRDINMVSEKDILYHQQTLQRDLQLQHSLAIQDQAPQEEDFELGMNSQGQIIIPEIPNIDRNRDVSSHNLQQILKMQVHHNQFAPHRSEVHERLECMVKEDCISLIEVMKNLDQNESEGFTQRLIVDLVHFCYKKKILITTDGL